MSSRLRRITAAALLLLTAACGDKTWLPLTAAVAEDRTVNGALSLVLVDGDLAHLAETIRVKAGKTVEIAAAPWTVPGGSGHVLGALAASINTAPGVASWPDDLHLRLVYPMAKQTVPLSVGQPGTAACAFSWTAAGGTLSIELEVRHTPQGLATASLASEPTALWQQAGLVDAESCLAQVNPGAAGIVRQHVEGEVRSALVARFAGAAMQALGAVFAAGVEREGRVSTSTRWGDAIETRLSLRYASWPGADPASIAQHQGVRARAALNLALDVDRAACAVDAPPPGLASTPLPPQAPAAPVESAFFRRALVLDRATLAHVAWALARSGALCQETPAQVPVEAASTAAAVPALGEWIESGPCGGRFWPGTSEDVVLVDGDDGPAIDWHLKGATLEVVGRVADTETVVVSVTANFRVRLRVVVDGGSGLGLVFVSASRDASQISCPLLGDDVLVNDKALDTVVDSALKGIFGLIPVLPLSTALPQGTVVTGLSRSADALWLWLEGGVGQ